MFWGHVSVRLKLFVKSPCLGPPFTPNPSFRGIDKKEIFIKSGNEMLKISI
jgi:hypothetical protein